MGLQHRLDGAEIGRDGLAHDALEERGLVLEVEIDRRLRESGPRRHVVEPRGGETLLHEQREGGVDDLAGPLGRCATLLGRWHTTNLLFSKFTYKPVPIIFKIVHISQRLTEGGGDRAGLLFDCAAGFIFLRRQPPVCHGPVIERRARVAVWAGEERTMSLPAEGGLADSDTQSEFHASLASLALLAGVPVLVAVWALLSPGLVLSHEMTWDFLYNLSGAWHLQHGHVAHVDFHEPVGQLNFMLTLLGFELFGPTPFAFLVGVTIVAAVAFASASVAAMRRLPIVPAALFVIFASLLVLMPADVGDSRTPTPSPCRTTDTAGAC